MTLSMATGAGLALTCDPCGVQWASVAVAVWVIGFFATGIALCWWIDREWPLGPWNS